MLIEIDRSAIDDATSAASETSRECIENLLLAHHTAKHVVLIAPEHIAPLERIARELSLRARGTLRMIRGQGTELRRLQGRVRWSMKLGLGPSFTGEVVSLHGKHIIQASLHDFLDHERLGRAVLLGEQEGFHAAMRQLLPNAMFIGFTGTPLLKTDKRRSVETFGGFIHTYKFDEAVEDKVMLDLRYEARDIEQSLTSPAKVDQWFEAKTAGLTDLAKAQLKKRWGTMQKVLSSQSRLERIVGDILLDMEERERFKTGRGNALLAMGSIYEACKVYDLFYKTDLRGKCAIVTSYRPTAAAIKGRGGRAGRAGGVLDMVGGVVNAAGAALGQKVPHEVYAHHATQVVVRSPVFRRHPWGRARSHFTAGEHSTCGP